ncbi:MAG: peptidoglycan bridge formation glycyltransferase FemA/FemB family protein, partial [Chloroflexota bacterium]
MLEQFVEMEEQPYGEEDAEWDAFVAGHPQGSLLQTTNWARLKNRFGWRSQRVWLRRDGQLVAGAQMLVRAAALGLIRVAYVPHGPLVDWDDAEQLSVLLNQLDHAVYQERAGLLKMEPLIWQSKVSQEEWQALCQREGCLPDTDTIQPPRTLIVDLRPSEEEILARM